MMKHSKSDMEPGYSSSNLHVSRNIPTLQSNNGIISTNLLYIIWHWWWNIPSKSDMEPGCRRVFVNPPLPLQPTHKTNRSTVMLYKTNSVAPFYITAAVVVSQLALHCDRIHCNALQNKQLRSFLYQRAVVVASHLALQCHKIYCSALQNKQLCSFLYHGSRRGASACIAMW